VQAASVPLPGGADAASLETCLTGGDDYELLMAVEAACEADLRQAAARLGFQVTRIGGLTEGEGVQVLDGSGHPMAFSRGGWSHF